MNPGPTRSGWADGRAATVTLSREDSSLPGRVLDDVHAVTTDDAMRRDIGVLARASGRETIRRPVAWLTVDEGRQQLEELSPVVASLAVSVITVTVLLTVIAHGARQNAGPALWSRAGPGKGSWCCPGPSCPPTCRSGRERCSCPAQIVQAMSIYRKLGASSRSQAVARSRGWASCRDDHPVFHPIRRMEPAAARGGLVPNRGRRYTDQGPRVAGSIAQVSRGTDADAPAHPPDTGAGPGCTAGASG